MRRGALAVGGIAIVAVLTLLAAWAVRSDALVGPEGPALTTVAGSRVPTSPAAPSRPQLRAAVPGAAVVAAAEESTDGDSEPARVEVRVLDDSGEPRPGAVVRAARLRHGPDRATELARESPGAVWPAAWGTEVRTDADGKASLDLATGRAWIVHATADGCAADAEIVDPAASSLVVLAVVSAGERALRVRDRFGDPVPGAEILVVESRWVGPPSARFVADGEGNVRVRCVEGEPLLVLASGFVPGRFECDPDLDEIVLTAGVRIAGVVTDLDDRPVAGARLRIGLRGGTAVMAASDTAGRFEAEGIDVSADPGELRVRVTAAGYRDRIVYAWPGTEDVAVRLARGGRLEGVVVHANGSPAPGADVIVTVRGADDVGAGTGSARADDEGRFGVDLEPGPWTVVAQVADPLPGQEAAVPEFRGSTVVDVTDGGRTTGVRIVVEPQPRSYASVRVAAPGSVPTGSVLPPPAGTVWFQGLGAGEPEPFVAVPLVAGRAVAALPVPPGTRLVATARVHVRLEVGRRIVRTAREEIVTAARADADSTPLPIGPTVTVRIRPVLPDGAEAPVEVSAPEAIDTFRRIEGGAFETAWDPWSPLSGVLHFGPVRRVAFDFPPPHTDGVTYDVTFPGTARIRGRVVDVSGAPVRGCWVAVQGDATPRILRRDDSGDGSFDIPFAPAVRATLVVSPRGQAGWRFPVIGLAEVDASAGGSVDAGTIVAWSEATVRGRVTGPDGAPVPAALVTVSHDVAGVSVRTMSGPDGRYVLVVPAGPTLRVEAERPGRGGCGSEVGPFPPGPATLDLRIESTGSVRVALAEPGWATVGVLRARAAGRPAPWIPPGGEGGGAPASSVLLRAIPPGEVQLTLELPGRTIERTVTVGAGTTVTVRFE